MKNVKNCIEELSWHDIRTEVKAVNPKLTAIIDDISPDSSYKIFKASYAFGEEMLKEGHLQVPTDSGILAPLHSAHISKDIQDSLSYNLGTNPVSVILQGSAEIFIIQDEYPVSLYGLIPPGKILSTWKVLSEDPSLSPIFRWNMSSGARSLFMLPKISKATAHKRIAKELGLQQEPPKNLLEHWEIFKEIANHPGFGEHWACIIAFFNNKWFEHMNDPAFKDFKLYLLETAWNASNYWRHQLIWNLVFSVIQIDRGLKTSSYIHNRVKYILNMAVGAFSGYAPAIDDTAGPISRLQSLYASVYNLPYTPNIMQPYTFSEKSDRSVYFSFALPGTLEFSNKPRSDSSKLDDLVLTQSYIKKYLNGLTDEHLRIEGTSFSKLQETVDFNFYHTEFEKLTGIKNPEDLVIEDKYFNVDKKELFPAKSAFLRGCVRISKKSKT